MISRQRPWPVDHEAGLLGRKVEIFHRHACVDKVCELEGEGNSVKKYNFEYMAKFN